MEHRVMDKKEQQTEEGETCSNEMEYREQLQVIRIHLALISG